jgi:uncharacterized surface protein with fasciclin (FAS1) repeats
MKSITNIAKTLWIPVAVLSLTFTGCKENIDDSDLYTFTGEMMIDHFDNNPETFSEFATLLRRVTPTVKSESSLAELLSARGHYTCFAPTNEAVTQYIDSIYGEGVYTAATVPDSCAEDITKNCIIDNGDNSAYLSTDFPNTETGSFSRPNMNDRYLTISVVTGDGAADIMVNAASKILQKDIEVENGVIHSVDKVLSLSNSSVADLIKDERYNMTLFSDALQLTGWNEKLLDIMDEDYEYDHPEQIHGLDNSMWDCPEHRRFGYTMFVETNDVFNVLGIYSVEDLAKKAKEWYPDATDEDYKSEDNALNQFVSYHLLPMSIKVDKLVIHYNEGAYDAAHPTTASLTYNVWEYYETMGKQRRLMKITEGPRTTDTSTGSRLRINRYSTYNETYKNRLVENVISDENAGVVIDKNNNINALNGWVYPITSVLLYSTDYVAQKVLNERMRYDICALLPEMITNGYRRPMESTAYTAFPPGYFSTMTWSSESEITYLPGYLSDSNSSWLNFQGDEFNITGQFDFTLKLPPVPYAGTYEVRYGCNVNGNRGMAQIYFGEDKDNLPAYGIPIDLRVGGQTNYASNSTSFIGWELDADLGNDEELIEASDKSMRNLGYMKGAKYFNPGRGTFTARQAPNCLRYIVYTGYMEPEKTYYIRFKTVLDASQKQFVIDNFEIVPKSVYNSPIKSEDKW